MSNIMKKSEFTNVKNNMPLIKATAIMGIFTYVFLCCEYLFVNVLSLFTSADNTVSAQNCALGISAVGIMLYPVFNRFCKKQLGKICCAVTCVICVICIVLVCMHISYGVTLWMGFLLFLGSLDSELICLSPPRALFAFFTWSHHNTFFRFRQ